MAAGGGLSWSWSWRICMLLSVLYSVMSNGSGVVEAGKIRLTKQNRLATLFAGPSYSGNYFSIEGIYKSCYNVLKDQSVQSILLEGGTGFCEVWGVVECGEEGDGKYKPHEVYGAISALKWDGVRGAKDEIKRDTIQVRGVKSIRCFEKKSAENKE